MKKFILTLSFMLLVSFSVFFLFIRRGDERQIRKNLISLVVMISKLGDENEFIALANIQRIRSLFIRDCRIVLGAPVAEIHGQDRLVSALLQARRTVGRIEVDFYDISVILGENSLTAKTMMTVKVTGPDPRINGRIIEAREVEMHWKKVGGEWKIAQVRLIRTLHS